MDSKENFDFWYAVNNTDVLVRPKRQLESFGTTTIDYFLVTEPMDAVHQIRIREGRIHAYRPQIIAPEGLIESLLEGFSESQSEDYLNWLRKNQRDLMLLKYGFKIRKEEVNTSLVHEKMEAVTDRLTAEIAERNQNLKALIRGVDEPWEVCLLKLMVEMVQESASLNATQLSRDPEGHHYEVNMAFQAANRDPSKIQELANLLKQRNLFEEYEDRFFSLVRSKKG